MSNSIFILIIISLAIFIYIIFLLLGFALKEKNINAQNIKNNRENIR